jgi:heme-degrading monooxygenase HmoA
MESATRGGIVAEEREATMFSVLFEVYPKTEKWDDYLGYGKLLRPELEAIDGFVDNIRYRSLTREGWVLSLSGWRDEKALVRWRTQAVHHGMQEKGRFDVFRDYHLRVGQITRDTRLPEGLVLAEQRFDETEAGEGTSVVLIDAKRPPAWVHQATPEQVAQWLGLRPGADGLVGWDVFDAVLDPGEIILLLSWKNRSAAEAFERTVTLPEGGRLRGVRVIRDYGMFDRREAPQYYPDVTRAG